MAPLTQSHERITKLYEYFMMALPEGYEGELPRMGLMYFAYQSNLDYIKNAYLYAYIYKLKEETPPSLMG